MLIKIAGGTFSIEFSLNSPISLDLSGAYLLKGVSNLLDLSSYSTYSEFDISGLFSVHKGY